MTILIWINKSITANTYYQIIFSIIFGLLFSFLLPTVVFAQASQETDGKIHIAEVVQIDGTKKTVKYFRDKEWVIIPPAVTDGKLVDGSDAPSDSMRAKIAQKKILVKYDKWAQLMIAAVSKGDIFKKADGSLKEILAITEQWKLITKEQLAEWFYSVYILTISVWDPNWRWQTIVSSLESIAKIKLKLSESEVSALKQEAEQKAKNTWRSTTGAVID